MFDVFDALRRRHRVRLEIARSDGDVVMVEIRLFAAKLMSKYRVIITKSLHALKVYY